MKSGVTDPIPLFRCTRKVVDGRSDPLRRHRRSRHQFLVIQSRNEPHDRIRDGHNGDRTSVIRGQLEIRDLWELLVKIQDIIHAGAAPAVDVLGVVSHNRDCRGLMMERLNEGVLSVVDVLELVDKEPFQGSDPGLSFRRAEEVQRLERELIDMVQVLKSFRCLILQDLLGE